MVRYASVRDTGVLGETKQATVLHVSIYPDIIPYHTYHEQRSRLTFFSVLKASLRSTQLHNLGNGTLRFLKQPTCLTDAVGLTTSVYQ